MCEATRKKSDGKERERTGDSPSMKQFSHLQFAADGGMGSFSTNEIKRNILSSNVYRLGWDRTQPMKLNEILCPVTYIGWDEIVLDQ